ncbi:MAG: creatininase family protein [Rhodospirillales bacterium]|nr:creatininase family protein [Rhodospirillales bacterium]
MAEMTAAEMRAAVQRRPVVLLALGSFEDQGPHAPMGDYLSADAVALRIAERASEAGTETLLAPVLPFGGADYFASMPGGISLSQAALRAVLDDMLACLLRHGLKRIVVINGHGGNVQAIHEATQRVWLEQGVLVPSFYLWRVGYGLLPAILGAETARKASGHGADPLSSVAMHLFPALMRPDLVPDAAPAPEFRGLKVAGFASLNLDGAEIGVPLEAAQLAPNGVMHGDPRLCSAATGAALVDRLVEIGASLAARVAAWDA